MATYTKTIDPNDFDNSIEIGKDHYKYHISGSRVMTPLPENTVLPSYAPCTTAGGFEAIELGNVANPTRYYISKGGVVHPDNVMNRLLKELTLAVSNNYIAKCLHRMPPLKDGVGPLLYNEYNKVHSVTKTAFQYAQNREQLINHVIAMVSSDRMNFIKEKTKNGSNWYAQSDPEIRIAQEDNFSNNAIMIMWKSRDAFYKETK
jgi:hypothetical protein